MLGLWSCHAGLGGWVLILCLESPQVRAQDAVPVAAPLLFSATLLSSPSLLRPHSCVVFNLLPPSWLPSVSPAYTPLSVLAAAGPATLALLRLKCLTVPVCDRCARPWSCPV